MQHHYHLLINSNAGSGRGQEKGKELVSILEERDEKYTAYFTKYAGEEVEIVQCLAKETLQPWQEKQEWSHFPLLIVLGGDGTLHQVLNTLAVIDKKIPVAYVPAGSGNDFARGTGIKRNDTQAAFRQILEAELPQSVSMISFSEKNSASKGLVVNNYGIGLDATVVHLTNQSQSKSTLNKYKLGSLAYLFSLVKVLFTQKTFSVEVRQEEKKILLEKIFLATTTNHPFFGGGVKIAPHASAYEEEFQLIVVERPNFFVLIYLLIKLVRGTHLSSKYVHLFSGTNIQLSTKQEQYAQKDGEGIEKQVFDLEFSSAEWLLWF